MREILSLPSDTIEIDQMAVARRLGSPESNEAGGQLREALAEAEDCLIKTASPRCVVERIDRQVFARIFNGEGSNQGDTPLQGILERAEAMALFALTLGQEVSEMVGTLFNDHDYLTATLLDAMASIVAEELVETLEVRFASRIAELDGRSTLPAVLAYSPGYCGWHVSGQKSLFSFLKPEEIDVVLGPGYLMRPLKSVSGVLVSGKPEVHDFDMIFSCCSGCATVDCRARIARVTSLVDAKKEAVWTCSDE